MHKACSHLVLCVQCTQQKNASCFVRILARKGQCLGPEVGTWSRYAADTCWHHCSARSREHHQLSCVLVTCLGMGSLVPVARLWSGRPSELGFRHDQCNSSNDKLLPANGLPNELLSLLRSDQVDSHLLLLPPPPSSP